MSWSYYHQLDPFLIQITEDFGIRWYSLAYLIGALAGYFFATKLAQQGRISLNKNKILDLITYGALGVIAGGRLGYCLFYSPHLFLQFDSFFPFWGVLKIHQGGMASHGGILGLLLALWIYSFRERISLFSLVDLAALGGAVGLFLGRIANFINGELYGRVVQGKAFFSVKFPSEIFMWLGNISDYKVQLLSLKEVLPSLKNLEHLSASFIPSGSVWEGWINEVAQNPSYRDKLYYVSSLIVKNSHLSSVRESLEPLLFLRHPSQLYQSFFGGLLPFFLALFVWSKTQKEGLISSVWILSYIISRFITEFFRMPDAQLGYLQSSGRSSADILKAKPTNTPI